MAGAILCSKVEEAAARFPDFISELEGFLTHYGLPVGTGEALPDLAERTAIQGAFRDDLVSMLNVLCAEEERISYLELLGILLVAAVGRETARGLAFDDAAEEPVRRLFNFVVEARRPRPEEDLAGPAAGDHEEFAVPETFPPEERTAFIESLPAITPGATDLGTDAASRGSVLARALAIAADGDGFGRRSAIEPEPEPAPSREPASVRVVRSAPESVHGVWSAPSAAPSLPSFPQAQGENGGRPRVPVWAVGLAGVLLGLLISFLWQRRGAQPPAGAGNAAVASPADPARDEAERASKRRERAALIAHQQVDAAVAGAASGSPKLDLEAADEPDTPPAPTGGSKRGAKAANTHTATAVVPRGGAGFVGMPGPGTKALRPATGAMVPAVRAVDLNAPAETLSQGSRGLRTRLPSVVTGSSGIMAANVISAPAPAYPAEASAAKVEGEVVIEAVVGRDGTVKDARVVSGPELLREAAVNAVQHWQYRPYEVDGAPAEIATTARLQFRLNAE